jgi:septal ring factor EnvC (AmiA/AmiB activator)
VTATKPPPPPNERKPWTARMLEETHFSIVGRGRSQGYDLGEVDAFKARVVGRVAQLEEGLAREKTAHAKTRDRLRDYSDADAKSRHPWEGKRETAAVEAIVRGQSLAERHGSNADREVARQLANVHRMQDELEAALAKVNDMAAAGPPELVLPDEPKDPAQMPAWFRACKTAIEDHRTALADHQAALDESRERAEALRAEVSDQEEALGRKQASVVARLESWRDEVAAIDLTGESDVDLEATQAMDIPA